VPTDRPSPAPVLVCGLGALGQACLQRLLAFDLPLHGVDLRQPNWRDPELESRMAGTFTHGDMRRAHVLRQAGVVRASAILLLTPLPAADPISGGTHARASLFGAAKFGTLDLHHTPPVDREICELLVDDLRRQGVECTLDQDGGLDPGSWRNGSGRVPS